MVDDAPVHVIEIAVAPKGRADGAKLAAALNRIAAEDLSLGVATDEEAGHTILKGTSESHLDGAVDALRHDHGVDVDLGAPQVSYRETIVRSADVDYTHKRVTGPTAHFARVKLRVAPAPAGAGIVFASKIAEGALPDAYVAGVETGVRSALRAGVVAGFPVVDIRIDLIDGAHHEIDSSEQVFAIASRAAMLDALQKCGATLIEPLMAVEVTAAADHERAVVADLRSRRAKIEGRTARSAAIVAIATVPLSNLFGYADALRSITRGAGTFTMRFARYALVPGPEDFDPPPAAAGALRP